MHRKSYFGYLRMLRCIRRELWSGYEKKFSLFIEKYNQIYILLEYDLKF